MKLSPLPNKAYLQWITAETWHTNHYLDKQRFFKFVHIYTRYSRKKISASELREDICNRYKRILEEDYLQQEANYYSQLFDDLTEFIYKYKS